MEFTAKRLELLETVKKAAKLVNPNSPVEEMKGVYLESDTDNRELSVIANNFETAISLKIKASVLLDGKIVVRAKLLLGMLELLPGEDVEFLTDKSSVRVSSGQSRYEVPFLPGEHYPKAAMPVPDETVKLGGICELARKTVFAASDDKSKTALQCVLLKVRDNNAQAAACDAFRMMLVRNETESAGVQEFLLPARSLQTLASVSSDEDVYDAGVVNNEAVFIKKDMVFTMKMPDAKFIDANSILQSVKPKYTAFVNAEHMRSALDLLSVGTDMTPVSIMFADGSIVLRRGGETSLSSSEVSAKSAGTMPELGFHYKIEHLLKLFQIIGGTVKMDIDANGIMLVKTKNEVYFQLSVKNPAAQKNKSGGKESAA